MAQTKKEIRAAYDAQTYKQYKFIVRKDSELYNKLEKFNDEPLGQLTKRLLEKHFEQRKGKENDKN
jgi:hypothetical protein